MNRRFIVATALLVPALAFVSCKDSGNSNPVEPQVPNSPEVPSLSATKKIDVSKLIGISSRLSSQFTTQVTGPAPHDPVAVQGVPVTCFSGVDVGPPFPGIYGGIGFTWANGRGCELNNFSGASDPDGTVSGAFPTSRTPYIGKRLTVMRQITFFYAGGPQLGGAPRFNLPIDECESTAPATAHTSTAGCPAGTATDGYFDGMLFADNSGCNDGDPYVGRVRVVQDPTCLLFYSGDGLTYDNFAAFKQAHPGARMARLFSAAITGTGRDEPADVLILADQVVHYHIHRVNVRGD